VFGEALDVAWGFATAPGGYVNYTGGRSCIPPCVHSGDVIRLASVIGWATLAAAALLLIALRFRGRLRPVPFVVCAVVLVCVDLFHAGMGYNPAIDRKYASQPATPAIRLLERQGLARYVSIESVPQDLVPMKFGLYESRGYDLPIMHRFDRIWRREVSPESSSVAKGLSNVPLTLRNVTPRALRVQRLLGVTHLLQPPTMPELHNAGLRLVYDGADARVYRVGGALPRAFVVGGQRVVGGGEEALDAVTSAGFDGRRVAVTEGRVAGLPVGEGASGGSARIVSYAPERVVVRARSAGPGLLVLGDNYYPGWKAFVDGREVPIERVDYLFRGVRIGPGASTVEFRYEPLSWRIGWIVSLIALIALIAAIAVGWRRRPRAQSST
jgi:Bacterial membrane protein YfhO